MKVKFFKSYRADHIQKEVDEWIEKEKPTRVELSIGSAGGEWFVGIVGYFPEKPDPSIEAPPMTR